MEWGSFTGDLEGKVIREHVEKKLWKRVSLSVGEQGGIRLLGILINSCRRAPEREHLSLQELS